MHRVPRRKRRRNSAPFSRCSARSSSRRLLRRFCLRFAELCEFRYDQRLARFEVEAEWVLARGGRRIRGEFAGVEPLKSLGKDDRRIDTTGFEYDIFRWNEQVVDSDTGEAD